MTLNVTQLNEEIALNDGNGSALILLVDYRHSSFEIFKTYEDKNFSSADIQKHFEMIKVAYELGKSKLHPDKAPRVTIKENVEPKFQKKLVGISKTCVKCGTSFTAYHNRTVHCPSCKLAKP